MLFARPCKMIAVTTMVVFLLSLIILPSNTYAQDDLGNIKKTESLANTLLYVGIGIAVVAIIVGVARSQTKKRPAKKKNEEEKKKTESDSLKSSLPIQYFQYGQSSQNADLILKARSRLTINPIIGFSTNSGITNSFRKTDLRISNRALMVGLAVSF